MANVLLSLFLGVSCIICAILLYWWDKREQERETIVYHISVRRSMREGERHEENENKTSVECT